MVELVTRMLKSHKDVPKSRTAPDKTAINDKMPRTVDGTQGRSLGAGVKRFVCWFSE
jgi:hypothetical protein